jgi:hypothetical protein
MVAVLNSWQYYMKTHFGYGCISSTVTVTCVTELTYQHRAVLRKPRRFGYSKDEFANVASPATDPPSPFGSSVSLPLLETVEDNLPLAGRRNASLDRPFPNHRHL